jgi:H+/Cl- antiporter ClcA
MPNRFNRFMDAWMLHRWWGLPLRMVFVCDWHRKHALLIVLGVIVGWCGYFASQKWLIVAAALVAGPSILCFLLLPILAFVFIGLENLFGDNDGK